MSDRTKMNGDRSLALDEQDWRIRYLARKHGLSAEQARTLIAVVGKKRKKLKRAARKLIT